ncbi:MAG TPA: hypothetical protein VEB65_12320 [Solirubrobacterales bacterium]|nr:hypothetical protein [Solirubrobacterales bacterium]
MRDLVRRVVLCGAALGMLAAADAGVAAAAAGEGSAKGRTAQGRVVRLQVEGKQLRMKHFTAELRCRDGSELIVQESGFVPTTVTTGGSFSDKQFGSTDTVRFKGTVGNKAVKGKIRVNDRWGKVRCNSRWISFNARFRG